MTLYDINLYKIANRTQPIAVMLQSEASGETFPAVLLIHITNHEPGDRLQYGGRVQTLEGNAILPGEYMLMLKDNLRGRIFVQDVSPSLNGSACEYTGHEDLWIAE
jgi:hypothetical protein